MNRLWCLHLALLSSVLGCSEPVDSSGTNTNWLRACEATSECGDLVCTCGHCTPTCNSDADCSVLGGICSPSQSAVMQCQGTTTDRVCLPRCSSSADCGPDELCHHGACTHTLAPVDCAQHPDALVCEDFEGALDGYLPVVTAGNSARSVEVASPSGARALEARVLVAPSTAYLRADFEPVSAGLLAVRGWFQIPAGQTTYDLAPLGFWSEQEPDWAFRVVVKAGRLEAWSYTTPLSGSAPISEGEWHCVEASIDIADAGRVQIALDGAPVVDAIGLDTLPTGGINALAMGTEWAGATATILVDRVLAGPTLAGCFTP